MLTFLNGDGEGGRPVRGWVCISVVFLLILSAGTQPFKYGVAGIGISTVPDDVDTIQEAKMSVSQKPDYWPTEGWKKSSPEEQGISSAKLNEMMQYAMQQNIGIDSVVVVRNGYIVMEEYPRPLLYGPENPHPLYSVTKSFSSALIGIAIKEGYIDGVQHEVLDFFPNRTFANMDSWKEAITLEHLLTMTSGLPWDEWTYPYGDSRNDVTQLMLSSDPVQFVLDRPMVSTPGTVWVYNSGGSHLLSAIVNETTGTDTEAFAREYLFDPLGVSNLFWGRDPFQHVPWGFMGLSLTPLDMAKFGYLYLNNGTWDGQQIIPAEWVTESTNPHFSTGYSWQYGYQWWIKPGSNIFVARGYMGQNIIVAPDYNMVVVFTGSYLYGPEGIQLFHDYIIPAVGPTVPDDYPTIQDAINHATVGDIVLVRSGAYYEHIVVNKTISLVGEDVSTTIIDGNETGRVIDIISDNVNFTGFTVQRSGSLALPDLDAGICLDGTRGCTISGNNIVHNGGFGVHLLESNQNTVSGNNLTDSGEFAISLTASSNNTISSNFALLNRLNGIGIHALSQNNIISDNTLVNSTCHGITLNNVCNCTISGNHLTNNSEIGIWLQADSINNTICGNVIAGSRYGIGLSQYSDYNTIAQNNISMNEYGLFIEYSTQNTIYQNNFVNNTGQVYVGLGSINTWDNGYPNGGNYWSDYSGYDEFSGPNQNVKGSDGIGDTPVMFDENNMDRYPLMAPWTELSTPIGDINADGKVDMRDVGYVARRFMCVAGDPLWDANADFNSDEKIDMVDIGTVARHFGGSLP